MKTRIVKTIHVCISNHSSFPKAKICAMKITTSMNKLIYNPDFVVELPNNELEITSKEYLGNKVKDKINNGIDIKSFWKDIVKDELNVKKIEFGAEMSEYVNFEIKPNLPVLGKEYGKLIPKIKQEIANKNQMDLANKVKNGEAEYIEIEDKQIPLNSDNLLITMQGKEGFAFSGEGEIGVVLDTHITDELKKEGYVREILSKVQNMRKDKGFEVLDNINLYISGNAMLEEVIKQNAELIKHDTLAINIIYNQDRKEYTETNINGETLNIDVEVVNK